MQLPSITFEIPAYWLLLPVAALLFWFLSRRNQRPRASRHSVQVTILRCCCAALVIGAMCGPTARWQSRGRSVVFLVDESRSISPSARVRELSLVDEALAAKGKKDQVGVITFGAHPVLSLPLTARPGKLIRTVSVDDKATDIGAALRMAAGELQPGDGSQIVLLTDALNTQASAGDSLSVAASGSIPVSAVDPTALLGRDPPEASVARVDLPLTVYENEPIAIRAVVTSSLPQSAVVTATLGGEMVASQTAQLAAGKTLVTLPARLRGSGIRRVEVTVNAPNDTLLENNSAAALTRVIGKPRILYLSDAPQAISPTLQRAMQARSIVLDVEPALQAPTDVAGFAAYDSVVLSDVPASELSGSQQSALVAAVSDFGVGLGMVGGTSSFISGGWRGTPVESALPVTMSPRPGDKIPAADVVVVLDASNSMSEEEGGVEKVQLAARAAVALLGTLQPVDRVAVISVTETPTTVLPFSSPAQALAARKTIEGVEAGGGGIYCLTGLEAAYDLLDTSHAAIKHVVLVADATDSEEQQHCVELAQRMRIEEHISTSCCGIGDWGDSDVGFQRSVSNAGGGQLYIVSQAADLPQFFRRDVSHLQAPPYKEGSFIARATGSDPLIAGLPLSAAPPLLGYDLVTARKSASVALRAPQRSDPFLAYQNFGLGRTFAFTSDETAHWGARWLPWSGYGAFWSRVLRWSFRRDRPAAFQLLVDLPPGAEQGRIIVDAFRPDGSYRNGAAFRAVIAAPASLSKSGANQVQRVALAQTGPGRYEASFPTAELGQYLVSVNAPSDPGSGVSTAAVSQPYLAEYAQTPPDLALLNAMAQQTGGRILSSASDVWKLPQTQFFSSRNIAPWFLLLGVILFLLDIAARRLGWSLKPLMEPTKAGSRLLATVGAGERRVAALRAGIVDSQAASRETGRANLTSRESEVLSRAIGRRVEPSETTERRADASRSRRGSGLASTQRESDQEEAFPLVASLDDLPGRNRARIGSNEHDEIP